MKRTFSVLTLALVVSGALAPTVIAASEGKFVASLFSALCLAHLPNYEGADLALEAAGYHVTPYGDNEFEFSHSSNGVWGGFGIGQDNPGCTIIHETVSREEARELGLSVIRTYSGKEPKAWNYSGEQSGWTVPFEGRVLYVIFNEGGLSSDVRDN